MHQITTLGHIDAQKAIGAIQTELVRTNKAATIAVADASGELIGLLRLDGAAISCVAIASNKAFTAAREKQPTRDIGKAVRDPVTGFDISYYSDPRHVGWGGGIPVLIDGTVVGSVAVSGLPEDEDAMLAEIGVAAILGKQS